MNIALLLELATKVGCASASASSACVATAAPDAPGVAREIADVYADRRVHTHDPRTVAGLGDLAFWDGTTLGALSGRVFAHNTIQGALRIAPRGAPLLAGEQGLAWGIMSRLW